MRITYKKNLIKFSKYIKTIELECECNKKDCKDCPNKKDKKKK